MKKIVTILVIILIIVSVVLIGRRAYFNTVGIKPDELYLTKENSQESFKTSMGSYKWDDKGMQVIADSISPLEIEFSEVIEVKQNEKLYFNDCNWTNVSSVVLLQKDDEEVARLAIESNLEEKYIVVPSIALDEYIVQINLESQKGTVWYAVKLNINE